jgi:SUKH superfamily protein
MDWVDMIQEATGWHGSRWRCDWREAESELGVSLPSDYKELCERFGPGEFSSSIWVMFDQGEDCLLSWRDEGNRQFKQGPGLARSVYDPYGLYGVNGQSGLLWWGNSDAPGCFFWLADAEKDPDKWPILAREEMIPDEEWSRYEMTASELVYRMITDPESYPLSMLNPQLPPTFERDPSVSGT